MSTASPNPFDGWSPDACLKWLGTQCALDGHPPSSGLTEAEEIAAITDDDLVALFDAEVLVDAFGEAAVGMAKAWVESQHKRDKGGKFSTVEGAAVALATGQPVQSHTTKNKPTIGDLHAAQHGITGGHRIVVKSKRVTKYADHDSVESYVGSHARGRAHALRTLAADHKAGRIAFEAAAAPAPKPAPSLQPLTGGKVLTGDHVIASASDNLLFAHAGVKTGDTLDEAAAKIAGNGYGPGVTATAFAQAHQAGKITTATGGKAQPVPLSDVSATIMPKLASAGPAVKAKAPKAAKPSKPTTAKVKKADAAAKPAKGWKDDPARWAKATAAPLSTRRFMYEESLESRMGTKDAKDLIAVRAATGLSFTGNKGDTPVSRAVRSYCSLGSGEINGAYRFGTPLSEHDANTAAELDKLCVAERSKADVVMYRGIRTTFGANNLNDLPPPATFDDKGFVSLSFNPGVSTSFQGATAQGHETMFRVRVPKGTHMANIGRNPTSDAGLTDEAECILPRGSKFTYVGHQMIGGRKIIDVEVMPN